MQGFAFRMSRLLSSARFRAGLLLPVMVLGLLLWARFVLITGHPRTATAVPPGPNAVAVEPEADANRSAENSASPFGVATRSDDQ